MYVVAIVAYMLVCMVIGYLVGSYIQNPLLSVLLLVNLNTIWYFVANSMGFFDRV